MWIWNDAKLNRNGETMRSTLDMLGRQGSGSGLQDFPKETDAQRRECEKTVRRLDAKAAECGAMSDHMLVFSTSCADAAVVAFERVRKRKWTASLRTPGPMNQREPGCVPNQSREPRSVMLIDEEWKADPSMQQFGNQDLREIWITLWDLQSWLHHLLEINKCLKYKTCAFQSAGNLWLFRRWVCWMRVERHFRSSLLCHWGLCKPSGSTLSSQIPHPSDSNLRSSYRCDTEIYRT